MDTKALERFARAARRQLHEQIAARLDAVLGMDSAELRGYANAIGNLRHELHVASRAAVIERVAYTWFNRFCALRYMDANGYTPMRVVSPADGGTLPEILQEAKAGVFDDELSQTLDRKRVADLLAGRMRSGDSQGEAYRLLLVSACNAFNAGMPFLFEPIGDVTELLMPLDLLSPNSVVSQARAVLTPQACEDVEVIGWLYQFYNAEKKEEVDAKVKRGGKVEADELPAKTALYTPHWIVRYLVENSLGRLWLLNRPHSSLAEHMPYYIQPEEPETDFLKINAPEELTVCDPACGSGHMLTYAFDLLYRIYEEEGYNPPDIPRLILEKNLFGMEIDPRSAALAAFALTMKARKRDRRFLRRGVTPRVIAYKADTIAEADLRNLQWYKALSKSLVDLPIRNALLHDLELWEQIENIGSLMQPQLTLEQIETLQLRIGGARNLLDESVDERIMRMLEQLSYLARRHCVAVANPPYLGGSMNDSLKAFAQDSYPNSKADTFAMFTDCNLRSVAVGGFVAMITMQSWMFLASYEDLRILVLTEKTIVTMSHLGSKAFDTIGGDVVSTTAFVIENRYREGSLGVFVRLVDGESEHEKEQLYLAALGQRNKDWYRCAGVDFQSIPGTPIAYWASPMIRRAFAEFPPFSTFAETRIGLITGDNDRYIRFWHEVSHAKIGFGFSREDASMSPCKWFPQSKGGSPRKWFGNNESVVDWSRDGAELQTRMHSSGLRVLAHNFNLDKIFMPGLTWTKISSGLFTARLQPKGFLFNDASANAFPYREVDTLALLGFLCSKLPSTVLPIINPTLNFLPGNISALPLPQASIADGTMAEIAQAAVSIAKVDWDSFELSWDFNRSSLVASGLGGRVQDAYESCRDQWRQQTEQLRGLERRNSHSLIQAFGLEQELSPDIALSEVTLTTNPHYRYGNNKPEAELERLLKADTMREFISYAVGCMFGRYSLDKPGLVLANAGDTLATYLAQVPAPTFLPDKDNVLPILDGEWFADDIVARFGRFLRVTFGDEHYAENLAFIEEAIGRDLRSFFVREFYDDHLKRYQRRPIYWLFSSPGGSFNALIYMHRYQPDAVSVVLNDYLREYQAKLAARRAEMAHESIRAGASNREKAAAVKEVARLDKVLKELAAYEDTLLDLARKRIGIDLDDGVKVNYAKFGSALRKVVGLNA